MFSHCAKPVPTPRASNNADKDIEDIAGPSSASAEFKRPTATVTKRKRKQETNEFRDADFSKSWREVLGNPPPVGNKKVRINNFNISSNIDSSR